MGKSRFRRVGIATVSLYAVLALVLVACDNSASSLPATVARAARGPVLFGPTVTPAFTAVPTATPAPSCVFNCVSQASPTNTPTPTPPFTASPPTAVPPPINTVRQGPANVPLLGDVNGDGKADAVHVDPNNGNVWVALSTGSGFNAPVLWSANSLIANASRYFLADVNGDGKADIIAFYAATGNWWAGTSSGSGFWPPTQWASNEGAGSSNQFIADVNGDHMADVVTFFASTGNWYVDTSSSSGFWGPPLLWLYGSGIGSTAQAVADFNGDGKADSAVYFASNGNWYVAASNGSSSGNPNQWSAGHGMNSNLQLAGDISGDHRADISYFYSTGPNCGTWEAGTSSGSGFWQPTYWAYTEGCTSTTQFIADANGDGKADLVMYWENAGVCPAGTWTVDTSSGTGFYGPPNQWINGFGENYQ